MLGNPVDFIGEPGYMEGKTYNVTVYRGELEWGIEFPATGPIGSWDSSGKEPGTYSAALYNVTDNELVDVDTVHFGLWGVDMQPDTATISGGGVEPNLIFTFINITDESGVSVEDYPKEGVFDADENGEFQHAWNFVDAPMGTYTVTLNGTGTYDDGEEKFELETTIDLTAAGRADLIQQGIDDKIVEIQDAVDAGEITDIEGALIAKLSRISDKIQQAIDWLGNSRDKVARNMLNAARNKLKAFINQVRAQSGKHISEEVATILLEQADNLVELIDGLIGSIDEGQTAQPLLSQTEGKGKGNNGKGNGKGNNGKGNGKGKGKGKPQ